MRLGNLPTQGQSDSRSLRLGSKEGHEEVAGLGQSRTIVLHVDLEGVLTPETNAQCLEAGAG
jgi:hypothetical protein